MSSTRVILTRFALHLFFLGNGLTRGVRASLRPRAFEGRASLSRAGRARTARPGNAAGAVPNGARRRGPARGLTSPGCTFCWDAATRWRSPKPAAVKGRKDQKRAITSKKAFEITPHVRTVACRTPVFLQLNPLIPARKIHPSSTHFSRPFSCRPLFTQVTLPKSMETLL